MKFSKIFFLFFFLLQNAFADTQDSSTLDYVLRKLPEWEESNQKIQIERVETGLTNHNFKVIFPTKAYFVRLGSDNPSLLGLDSDREFFCTEAAASLGIAPSILMYLPEKHAMVLPFIASKPLTKNRENIKRILSLLTKFHQSDIALPTRFCPYQVIKDYYWHATTLRSDHHVPLASYLLTAVEEIHQAIPTFKHCVPCHLDLYFQNFLDDGANIWIIDWEYSAMADPLFDLATLVVSDNFSFLEMQELLKLYLDEPSEEDLARLYLLSILADIRWGLWSYIQAEVSQIKASYLSFADTSTYRVLQKMADPQYQKSLNLLKNCNWNTTD